MIIMLDYDDNEYGELTKMLFLSFVLNAMTMFNKCLIISDNDDVQ